jgi:hypothetical protein
MLERKGMSMNHKKLYRRKRAFRSTPFPDAVRPS